MANSSWFGLLMPQIVAYARQDAVVASTVTLWTYTVGGADGTFEYGATCTLTTAGSANFTGTIVFTDESNVSRTMTIDWATSAGAFPTAVTSTGQYAGTVRQIRAKAGTTITCATTGTVTGATYNIEATLKQIK